MDYAREVGERLAHARREAAMTQREVGERVGVTSTTVSRWERGAAEPHRAELRKAADALGVDWRWILSGDPPGGEPLPDLLEALRAELAAVRLVAEANASALARVDAQIESLAESATRRDELTERQFDEVEERLTGLERRLPAKHADRSP